MSTENPRFSIKISHGERKNQVGEKSSDRDILSEYWEVTIGNQQAWRKTWDSE